MNADRSAAISTCQQGLLLQALQIEHDYWTSGNKAVSVKAADGSVHSLSQYYADWTAPRPEGFRYCYHLFLWQGSHDMSCGYTLVLQVLRCSSFAASAALDLHSGRLISKDSQQSHWRWGSDLLNSCRRLISWASSRRLTWTIAYRDSCSMVSLQYQGINQRPPTGH